MKTDLCKYLVRFPMATNGSTHVYFFSNYLQQLQLSSAEPVRLLLIQTQLLNLSEFVHLTLKGRCAAWVDVAHLKHFCVHTWFWM